MKRTHQRLLILSIILLVGLGIFFLRDIVTGFFAQQPEKPFASIEPDQVTGVTIKTESETENLIKTDGSWVVVEGDSEFPADQGRVNTLIDAFINLEQETIASENPDRHTELGIGETSVTLKTGDDAHTLFIGDTTQVSQNFVRINEENNVYIAAGFNQVNTPIDYRDLTIPFVQNENAVSRIEITEQGSTLTLSKQENEWYIGGEKANQSEMSFYVNELSVIRASSIVDGNPIAEQGLFTEATITVTEGENVKTVEFYPNDDTTKYAQRQDGETVYEINATLVDSLTKTRAELIEEESTE
jgi:hypothetical protein